MIRNHRIWTIEVEYKEKTKKETPKQDEKKDIPFPVGDDCPRRLESFQRVDNDFHTIHRKRAEWAWDQSDQIETTFCHGPTVPWGDVIFFHPRAKSNDHFKYKKPSHLLY